MKNTHNSSGNSHQKPNPPRIPCSQVDNEEQKKAIDSIHMEIPEVANSFVRIKPLCDKLIRTPDLKIISDITACAKKMPNNVIQEMHTYILFPFMLQLNNPTNRSNTNIKIALVDSILEILSKVSVETPNMFFKYFSVLNYQFFDKNAGNSVAKVDEDFALKVCKTILALTLGVSSDIRLKLYNRTNAPEIGQGIYLCIQIAKTEKYKPLRISAIQCVLALNTVHDDLFKEIHNPRINIQYVHSIGEVLMFFLPGLLGGLQEIATGDPKQGHTITCLALRGIRRILCLVMHDKEKRNEDIIITDKHFIKLMTAHKNKANLQPQEDSDPFGKNLRNKGREGMLEYLENAKRDTAWYRAAGKKLVILIRSLRKIKAHPHEKVRVELATLCFDIISYCVENMSLSLKYIFEILVTLSENDDDLEVNSICSQALLEYGRKTEYGRKDIVDILEENFINDLSRIPRFLNDVDSDQQNAGLYLLRGYIRILTVPNQSPPKLVQMLNCSFIMNRFVFALIEIFKMEVRSVKLLEEFTVRDIESESLNTTPWRVFTHLNSQKSIEVALSICSVIGQSQAGVLIVDYLFDLLTESEHKKEILLILNEIITSPVKDIGFKEHLIKTLVNTYIELENWYMCFKVGKPEKPISKKETLDVSIYNPREWIKERTLGLYEGGTDTRYTDISYKPTEDTDNDTDDEDCMSCYVMAHAQDNIVKMCLITEGIGMVAKLLGEDFQPYLLRTLYLILERAGSSNEMLHLAGMRALINITKAFKYKDVTELIKDNADYFTHHVNLKLRKISDNAGVLDVLLVVMRYSETAVLPCLYDIVNSILTQSLGIHRENNAILFLRLFFTFVKYIKGKFTTENVITNKTEKLAEQSESRKTVLKKILDFHENRLNSLKIEDENCNKTTEELYKEDLENKNSQENDNNVEDTDKKPTPPVHIKMVANVVSKTLNFIPSNDREEQLLAINIVNEGILIIKDWEDEMLPIVHLVWAPLVNRFKEPSQHLIFNRSFQLLLTLAKCSKDFIRSRTVKDVLPNICDFMKKSANDSYMKDVGSVYRFSQAFKLQLSLLDGLGDLCLFLNLQEREIDQVMCATSTYLSCKQPKPLQQSCLNIYKQFMNHDPAPTWLYLKSLWSIDNELNRPVTSAPCKEFEKVNITIKDPHRKLDFKHNVTILLDYYNRLLFKAVTNAFGDSKSESQSEDCLAAE